MWTLSDLLVITNEQCPINRRDIDYTLLKLGAIYSLEPLRPDDLYRLLLELPNTDPDGKIASSIYRSVIEHGGIDTDSPLKYKFIDEGSMWGALGEIQDYYPVRDLKYSSIGVLPRPVYEMVPLVDIDPRRSTKEIERVFGVSTLRKEDVQIEIQEDYTEYQDWSHIVSNHVKNAIPYLYAFRLSRTADETGREGRIFSRMRLDICQKISANIQLWDKKEGGIIIKGDLDGITVDDRILLVSENDEMPHGDQVFWRAIGDLLADLVLIPGVASEFASILACAEISQMRRLLGNITHGRENELVGKANERLSLSQDENVDEPFPIPPRKRMPDIKKKTDEGEDTDIDEGEGGVGDLPENFEFKSTSPPIKRRAQRRSFVVARISKESQSQKRKTIMVDEEETLKIVMAYEISSGDVRYPILVNHIHGYESLGCDVISVSSEEIRENVIRTGRIDISQIERFIEVKGKTNRTGAVELTENQIEAAHKFGKRFYLYRVFLDPSSTNHYELAVLCDPIRSKAMKVYQLRQFDLREGSGSEWYELVEKDITEDNAV